MGIMSDKIVIGGSGSQGLAARVAHKMNATFGNVEIRTFPDGEKYLRIHTPLKGKEAILIQTMGFNPDQLLMELLFLAETAQELGASKIKAVIPYFAYSRQDVSFKRGEVVSFRVVSKLLESSGIEELYTVDIHLHRIGDASQIFNIPCHNLTAMPLIGEFIRDNYSLTNPQVLAPDEEAEQWAEAMARELGADFCVMEKIRKGPEEVEISCEKLGVGGREVIITDDIISTGGTMATAISMVKDAGAKMVISACTHPLLIGGALSLIHQAGALEVIGTDTVPSSVRVVSIDKLLADNLR
jgi:ribose-phosphate pyrophosphokinase